MDDSRESFARPPVVEKKDGSARRVGYELEFSGIKLDEAAAALKSVLGGRDGEASAAHRELHTDAGLFRVELDWDYLKRLAADDERAGGSEWIEQLSQAAALVVPVEVVCPPIAITELEMLDPMVDALRAGGAVGTEESLLAAYGVHVNPEIPALDAHTLFAYLRAYALLQWWLVDKHEVDATRRLGPHIDLYSEAYLKLLLGRSEATFDEIAGDYLDHNATRNRALDLLPLLAEVDEQRVRAAVDDPKVTARPTFHYRLPNCQIEKPDWSLARSWNIWCVVERLAARSGDLDTLAQKFLAADRPVIGLNRRGWVAFIDQWLIDRELA